MKAALSLARRFFDGRTPSSILAQPIPGPLEHFRAVIDAKPPKAVLEVGTARAVPDTHSHHMHLFPGIDRTQYTMVDIKGGQDVDVVADIHSLPGDWTDRYDAVVASAVFEHLARPWIAAKEVARVLAPGGVCYAATHQTFPLHGYPQDFWRFSTEALALIFTDAGLEVIDVAYKHRTKITLPADLMAPQQVDQWNADFPSWAIVHVVARKHG